jgi:putative flippase GtrA
MLDSAGRLQFMRYLVAGGIAAAANYFSRFVFSLWVSFEVAVVIAFGVGLCTGFVLMRQFVFGGAGKPVRPQAVKYLGVNLVALVLTVGVSSLMARLFLPALGFERHVEAIAHAFGVAVPVVTSYVGHRLATFR